MYQYKIFRYGPKNQVLPTDTNGWEEAKQMGIPHVIAHSDSTEQIFTELFKRFQPDQETLGIFKEAFLGHHRATNFVTWITRYPLNLNEESINILIRKIELWTLSFELELKQFFVDYYIKEAKEVKAEPFVLDLKNLLLARVGAMRPSQEETGLLNGKESQVPASLKESALKLLDLLSGKNVHGEKIMPDADFDRLRAYVGAMIERGGLPEGVEQFEKINFPNSHIKYLFYLIHNKLYTSKKIKSYFIDFIHTAFPQFTGNKKTTKIKFSTMPPTWDNDIEVIKTGNEQVTKG